MPLTLKHFICLSITILEKISNVTASGTIDITKKTKDSLFYFINLLTYKQLNICLLTCSHLM